MKESDEYLRHPFNSFIRMDMVACGQMVPSAIELLV
jgi:hypothetical protein